MHQRICGNGAYEKQNARGRSGVFGTLIFRSSWLNLARRFGWHSESKAREPGRWKNKSCVNGVSAAWGCDWKKKAELALELGAGASWRNLALPCPFPPLREAPFFYYFVQLPWSVTGDCSVNIASCQVKRNTFWSPDFWNFIEQFFSVRGMKTFDVLNIKLPSYICLWRWLPQFGWDMHTLSLPREFVLKFSLLSATLLNLDFGIYS